MNRRIRNISLGVVLGTAAAIVSITVIGNASSPDTATRPTAEPSPTSFPAFMGEPNQTNPETTATVANVVPFDPAQEATPVLASEHEFCGFVVDYIPVGSIEELNRSSRIVVRAKPEQAIGGNGQSEHFSLARVYRLNVLEYLKGEGPGEIEYVHFEGSFRRADLSVAVLEDHSLFESQENCFSIPEIGLEYVFFLRAWPSRPAQFVPATDPHRFALIDGEAVLDGNLRQIIRESKRSFPPLTAEELLDLVRDLN